MIKHKVVLLTTKTIHHKFFIKILEANKKIDLYIIYEKKKIKPKFKIGEIQKKKQVKFEKKFFFNNNIVKIKSPQFEFYSVSSNQCLKTIKKIKPDIGIIFGTSKVSEKLISVFKKKIINIHRGIMSKYRGLDSEFWASYNKDFNSIGTTIHYANKYLDKGKTIYEKKIKLKKNLKTYMLRYYTTLIASKKINSIVKRVIKNKKIRSNSQVHGKYYSFIPLVLKKIAYKNFDNYCSKIK